MRGQSQSFQNFSLGQKNYFVYFLVSMFERKERKLPKNYE